MFFVLCVVHDPEKCRELLDAWEAVGVTGATILHSTGLGRLRGNGLVDDLPLFPGLDDLIEHEEYFSRTIFSVVEDEGLVDQISVETQKILGDMSQPETGLLVVLPILKAYGMKKQRN